MPRRKIVIPSFNGVAAGESPTCTISVGPRFHAVFLRYKGTANQATIEADIAQIRVKSFIRYMPLMVMHSKLALFLFSSLNLGAETYLAKIHLHGVRMA